MKNSFVLFVLLLIIAYPAYYVYANNNIITVDYNREIGQVNSKLFGNNIKGRDPNYRRVLYSISDYGSGIWDAKREKPVNEVTDLAKEAGVSIIRYATGDYYNWKNAIGNKRKHFLFGFNEFFKTINEIGAEPVITVSMIVGNEQDAADLVEYLNSPNDGSNPGGGKDWAAERAKNGHFMPYKVKYFELGNEVYVGHITKQLNEGYEYKYLKYFRAMKKVDPAIKIGANVKFYIDNKWNKRVLSVIRENIDFAIVHKYSWLPKGLGGLKDKDILKITMGLPGTEYEKTIKHLIELLEKETGRNVPLAFTEYNHKRPLYSSLGAALTNAEFLRVFMKPENNLLMANHWNMSNGLYGMVKNTGRKNKYYGRTLARYVKMPNYFVYELYNKLFGDILIHVDVKSSTYDLNEYETGLSRIVNMVEKENLNLLPGTWRIYDNTGRSVEESKDVLKIDFNEPAKTERYVKNVGIEPDKYYRISGYIKSEGLIGKNGVLLEALYDRNLKESISFGVTQISANHNWQYVDITFKAPEDARAVNVILRQTGKETVKGSVYVKDLKLESIELDKQIPYLSVNASKSVDDEKIVLMIVNRNIYGAINSSIKLKNYLAKPMDDDFDSGKTLNVNTWTLNGPSVEATNDGAADNVGVVHRQFEVPGDEFEYNFEPHSLTAVEIIKK